MAVKDEGPDRPLGQSDLLRTSLAFDLGRIHRALRPGRPHELRVPVRRPDDLLVFDLLFDNLHLAGDAPPRLVRESAGGRATMIVELPPQSFGEEVFLQESNVDNQPPIPGEEVSKDPGYPEKNVKKPGEPVPSLPSAKVRMAGQSRLAFAMPAGEESLAFSLAAVLQAMRTWPLRLDVGAKPDDAEWLQPFRSRHGDAATLAVASAGLSWSAARAELTGALEARGARGISGALASSAERVAEQAAAVLAGGGPGCLPAVVHETFRRELDGLAREFRGLDEGPPREAAIAALSLATTEALADHASRLAVDADARALIPFLPLLLAPHEPPSTVTALELPYRLLLSPIESARFVHQDSPVEHAGRTELWHTRMTAGDEESGRETPGKVRALWSPDYSPEPKDLFPLLGPPPKPFRMPLDPLDRTMLVSLMAGYDAWTLDDGPFVPRASRAERLHLSALGALLDAEGNWSPRPERVDLQQWRHLTTLGRDHYVRVVYAGFLCCLGHAASLVKVSERKFERLPDGSGQRVAVLRQRFFIVVRERIKTYSGFDHRFGARNFPFRQVEILTRVTPDLLEPGAGASKLAAVDGEENKIYGAFSGEAGADGKPFTVASRMVFWPLIPAPGSGSEPIDFHFEVAATDRTGRRATFSVPLLFVGELPNRHRHGPIRAAYDAASANRRRASLGGATVTYAPFDEGDAGDSRLSTDGMTFAAGGLKRQVQLEPNFHPETASAEVGIRPLQKLLGQPNAVVEVTYPQVYKDHGFGEADPTQNAGKVFLQLIGSVYPLQFGGGPGQPKSDALGSLAAPAMMIQGLSKVMGPVAGPPPADPTKPEQIAAALGTVVSGIFDPAEFFSGATILGGVELGEILKMAALTGPDVPKMLSRESPDRVEASFTWETEIRKPDSRRLFIPRADSGKPQTRLAMRGLVTTPIGNPKDARFETFAELDNFKVNLFGFVILWFERLRFRAQTGQKADVVVELRQGGDAVQFGGPLEFVNELRNLIPANGFSDPPALEVTPSGIAASFSINLPAVQVGVLALSNASLGAGFDLPFDARPATVKLYFSQRQNPFSLTVSLLGGGGFFAIGVSTRGVNEIEAALEFGAELAIDLGVASGLVEIKAGVYFHWREPQKDKGSVELAGYVRLHGELSVLGLISASLTFHLQLAYLKEGGESIVWGEALLVVEIEVLFFSASVKVRCRRQFAGSKSDPKFITQIPDEGVWTEYCEAFAVEAA